MVGCGLRPRADFDPKKDNVPCDCTDYKTEALKRPAVGSVTLCSAKSRRKHGAVLCPSVARREIVNFGKLCLKHEEAMRAHKACAHCAYFPDYWTPHVLRCPKGHLTHLTCARDFSPPCTYLCSHCNEQQELPLATAMMTATTMRTNSVFAAKTVNSWTQWNESLEKNLSCGNTQDAVRMVRQLNDCHISGLIPVRLLLEAIECHFLSVIEELRCVGTPVSHKFLYKIVQWLDHEILKALQLHSSCGDKILNSIVDRETILMKAARLGLWKQMDSLLEMFDQTGVDLSITSDVNKTTLKAMCESAPCSVQNSLLKAATRFEMTQRLRKRKNIIIEDLARGRERFPIRVVNDVDEIMPDHFEYITRVKDTCNILKNRKQVEMLNCWCKDKCNSECPCCSNVYDNHGRIQDVDVAFIECSSDCMCSMRCGNRVAQKGATIPIEIFKSDNGRGWAVRALAEIKRGSFIGEYTGDLLTDVVSEERIDNYFFETNVGEETYTIDARLCGNFTRFINHSCQPNAKVTLVIWDWHAEQLNHLCIFAAESISKGQEITISYGDHWWNSKMPEIHCLCGAPNCKFSRHSLTENRSLGSSSTSSCSDDSPH